MIEALILAILVALIAVEERSFRRRSVDGRSPERERFEAEAR